MSVMERLKALEAKGDVTAGLKAMQGGRPPVKASDKAEAEAAAAKIAGPGGQKATFNVNDVAAAIAGRGRPSAEDASRPMAPLSISISSVPGGDTPSRSPSPSPSAPGDDQKRHSHSSRKTPPPIPLQAQRWTCKHCTLENSPNILVCPACHTKKPVVGKQVWRCKECTLDNEYNDAMCAACHAPRMLSIDTPVDTPSASPRESSAVRMPGFRASLNMPSETRLMNESMSSASTRETLGSVGMSFVHRFVRGLKAAATVDHKYAPKGFQLSAKSKMWIARRLNDIKHHPEGIQRWELEARANGDERLPFAARTGYVDTNSASLGRLMDRVRDYSELEASETDVAESEQIPIGRALAMSVAGVAPPVPKIKVPFIPPVLKGLQQANLSLSEVMAVPDFHQVLRQYMEEAYCAENLDFLEAIEDYKRIKPDDLTLAKQLFALYIRQGAPSQVNVDSATRKSCWENLTALDEVDKADEKQTLFDDCYDVIYKMVEKDVFARFTYSPEYAEMLATYLEEELVSGRMLKGEGWKNDAGFKSLRVDVVRASNLKGHDTDPYVILTMNGKSYQTSVRRHTTEPEWEDAHFEFPLLNTTQFFEANIQDHGVITADSFLGGIFVPIECVPTMGEHEVEYILLARERGQMVTGTLTLRLSLSQEEANISSDALIDAEKNHSLADVFRTKVSKKKIRYQEDGFDLDLTYITDRIIAMGWPSEGRERMYRNPLVEVRRFFHSKHLNCYKVYNLCSERSYPPQKFQQSRVAVFPFEDHNPPPFLMIPLFVKNASEWLAAHPQNVAAVHCKAGKGRTGTMVCALLAALQADDIKGADQALDHFAEKRTLDRAGVTIPSQRRYVQYADEYFSALREQFLAHDELESKKEQSKFAVKQLVDDHSITKAASLAFRMLSLSASTHAGLIFPPKLLLLRSIRMHRIPKAIEASTVDVWFIVTCPTLDYAFSSKNKIACRRDIDNDLIEFVCGDDITLYEDARIEIFYSTLFGKEKMLQGWINTRFVENSVKLSKWEVDKPHLDLKNKQYAEDFQLDMDFHEENIDVQAQSGGSYASLNQVLGSYARPDKPAMDNVRAAASGTKRVRRYRRKADKDKVTAHLVQRATQDSEAPGKLQAARSGNQIAALESGINQHMQALAALRSRNKGADDDRTPSPAGTPTPEVKTAVSADPPRRGSRIAALQAGLAGGIPLGGMLAGMGPAGALPPSLRKKQEERESQALSAPPIEHPTMHRVSVARKSPFISVKEFVPEKTEESSAPKITLRSTHKS